MTDQETITGPLNLENLDDMIENPWEKDEIRRIITERDEARAECAIARERLGPAGYLILQRYKSMESELAILKDPSDGRCMEIGALRERAKIAEEQAVRLIVENAEMKAALKRLQEGIW